MSAGNPPIELEARKKLTRRLDLGTPGDLPYSALGLFLDLGPQTGIPHFDVHEIFSRDLSNIQVHCSLREPRRYDQSRCESDKEEGSEDGDETHLGNTVERDSKE